MRPVQEDELTFHIDASWGNQFDKGRRSRSATLIMYGNVKLAATKRSQKCVSLSSAEAEYVTLAEPIMTIIWLRNELMSSVLIKAHRQFSKITTSVWNGQQVDPPSASIS